MEVFNLNIIPGAVAPIIHASQYDEDREFRANLFEGDQVFELTGEEIISVNVRKTDGNVVTAAVVNTGANYVEFSTTEQMTACAGANLCQLRIENSPRKIGTLNFILAVERDPLEGGIQSESEINNLETQVAEMVAEEVTTQYDSSNVIFDTEPTDNHGIGYTVTSEGIKTAIDNAFDYDNTASGSIVHIEDGADNIPVKSLLSQIVAVESGNGQPKSPTNPYTISGFDNGVISRCGVNIWNEQWEFGYYDASGAPVVDNTYIRSKSNSPIIIKPNTSYYFSLDNSFDNVQAVLCFYDAGFNFISRVFPIKNVVFTTPANAYLMRFYMYSGYGVTYNNDISINYPSTDTQYHAYNGNNYTFTFGQTVYGGHFDNKGNLVVTHSVVDLGTLTYTKTTYGSNTCFYADVPLGKSTGGASQAFAICSQYVQASSIYIASNADKTFTFGDAYIHSRSEIKIVDNDYANSTIEQFKTAMDGVQLVYELATPITLSITSQDIPTLLGENNFYSNTGNLEVNYYTSKSNDILEFVDSEIGKKNGTNIPIEENSQDSIKDYVDDEISSTKDYVDNGLNDKVAYKSGEVVYSNYVTGAYVSGSGNYVEFCIPINTKATSGTITNLGTTLNVFIGNTRLTNEVSLAGSSIVAIKDGYAQIELKLNSTQTANSVATVSLDGFTVNFA